MLARMDDAFLRERAFVADASHELRTPLAILKARAGAGARARRRRPEFRAAVALGRGGDRSRRAARRGPAGHRPLRPGAPAGHAAARCSSVRSSSRSRSDSPLVRGSRASALGGRARGPDGRRGSPAHRAGAGEPGRQRAAPRRRHGPRRRPRPASGTRCSSASPTRVGGFPPTSSPSPSTFHAGGLCSRPWRRGAGARDRPGDRHGARGRRLRPRPARRRRRGAAGPAPVSRPPHRRRSACVTSSVPNPRRDVTCRGRS